jgi:hypothetical protein
VWTQLTPALQFSSPFAMLIERQCTKCRNRQPQPALTPLFIDVAHAARNRLRYLEQHGPQPEQNYFHRQTGMPLMAPDSTAISHNTMSDLVADALLKHPCTHCGQRECLQVMDGQHLPPVVLVTFEPRSEPPYFTFSQVLPNHITAWDALFIGTQRYRLQAIVFHEQPNNNVFVQHLFRLPGVGAAPPVRAWCEKAADGMPLTVRIGDGSTPSFKRERAASLQHSRNQVVSVLVAVYLREDIDRKAVPRLRDRSVSRSLNAESGTPHIPTDLLLF